jgi:NADH-quinone oxidoreductase subunit N
MTWHDLVAAAPESLLVLAACAVLLQDAWATGGALEAERRGATSTWLALAGICAAAAAAVRAPGAAGATVAFAGMYVRDGITRLADFTALGTAAAGVLLADGYVRRFRLPAGEYCALVLLTTAGAMLMAASRNLIVLFVGLELLSLPLYVLAALARRSIRSQEAGLKYLLLGAFATAFFVYGVALVYGAAGTLDLNALAGVPPSPLLGGGLALLTIGLGFEAAMVPFHGWAPDVYEGAPLPAVAFMSVAAKIGAFAGLIRVFPQAFAHLASTWSPMIQVLAIATMVLGNLAALGQTNVKRLLAYSSVAHAGYMLIGIGAGGAAGTSAVLFYLAVYAAMNLGAFGVLLLLDRRGVEADRLGDLAGLASRAPWAAWALVVCAVSLAGLPPTGGFIAKLYLFQAALGAGQTGVAVAGVLTSVVSIYYYMRLAYAPFAGEAPGDVTVRRSAMTGAALVLATAGVLVYGIVPARLTAAVQQAAAFLK